MSSKPPKEKTIRKDGYEITFYEGFASRITVRQADGSARELFKQTETYHLPRGQKKPDTRHVLRLQGGSKKQDLTLDIHDPELRIAKITVELYGSDHSAAAASDDEVAETVTVDNHPRICPPFCKESEPE
jgi:hypothetical protein